MAIDIIVLATDFTEQSRSAEAHALLLADKFGAALHVVHGIEPIMGVSTVDETAEFEEFYQRLVDRAEANFEARAGEWGGHQVDLHQHVQIGPRWRVVLDTAAREGASLIVLGRRTFSGEGTVPLGTTSQKVFFGATCPVLFVPTD